MKSLIKNSVAALGLLAAGLAAAQAQSADAAQDIEEIVVVARSPAYELAQQLEPWLLRDLDGQILADIESLHEEHYNRVAGSASDDEKFAEMIARQWKRLVAEVTL